MLTAISLAALLAAGPTGNARLDQGPASVTLRLTSFETERVAAGKRGVFTSAELLYRSSTGERLDLRFLFRSRGELAPRDVTSIVAQTRGGGLSSWNASRKGGCKVKLLKATESALSGKVDCRSPESGLPFEAVFEAAK